MAKLYVIYGQPSDPAAFDAHYRTVHAPLARQVPGMRHYEVTRGPVMGLGGQHASYMIATLEFDSLAAISAALASPQGQATAADLANFASGGVDLMMAETETL